MEYSSSIVKIGKVALGGKNPVRIQSMTTTNTLDTDATVRQVKQLALAGCDYVRITTQNIKEAENLGEIKNKLKKLDVEIPLIADVHFNPKVAEVAAKFVEKVRINPGNYIGASVEDDKDVPDRIAHNLSPLIHICKQYNTAIRIGVNHGSLSKRILYLYGNTAVGMVESIMEFVRVCNELDFHELVLSLKASNVVTMIEANMLLVEKLSETGLNYPIHLGVTEAGSKEEGRIKSAAGIGYLLAHGIGDTIRVSLTEDPVEEIPVAQKLVDFFGQRKDITKEISSTITYFPKSKFNVKPPLVITSGDSTESDLSAEKQTKAIAKPKGNCLPERSETCLPTRQESQTVTQLNQPNVELYSIHKINYNKLSYDDLVIVATVEASVIMLTRKADGIWIENSDLTSSDNIAKLVLNIFQVLGLRITKTEYIACPTCGRSRIDVIQQLEIVKDQTAHLPSLKIAVMGCAVNGPGEMADAHYGCVGAGKGKVNIYKGRDIVQRNVPQYLVSEILIKLIKENNDWKEIE